MDATTLSSGKLKLGARGAPVGEVRAALRARYAENYSVPDANVFDAWMDACVRDFQRKAGLGVDGIVGPKTWAALTNTASPSTGPAPSIETGAPDVSSGLTKWLIGIGAALAVGGAYYFSKRKTGLGDYGEEEDEDLSPREKIDREIQSRVRDLKEMMEAGEISRDEYKLRAAQVESAYMRGGRGLPKGQPTYTTQRLTGGQRFIPSTLRKPGRRTVATVETVSRELKRMSQRAPESARVERAWTEEEQTAWELRDKAASRREGRLDVTGATARVPVNAAQYRNNESYRDEVQERARQRAQREKRRVTLVDQHGNVLYDFLPAVHRYGGNGGKGGKGLGALSDMNDIVSEKLILDVKDAALKRNCPKAVRGLFKVRALVKTPHEAEVFDQTARVVQRNCEPELIEEKAEREAIRGTVPEGAIDVSAKTLMSLQRAQRKRKVRAQREADVERARAGLKPTPPKDVPEVAIIEGRLFSPEEMYAKPASYKKLPGRKKVSAEPQPIRLRPKDKSYRPARLFPYKRGSKKTYRRVTD